nr:pentatricopeptide repeat-containing protein At4g20770 [Ipomoea batatas]GME03651.1 pentatricopeptide repeat-containing protein At4g20770 [Ipomoea batatas]
MQAKVNASYIADLLQTCIDNKAHFAGKLLHGHIVRLGLSSDTFLGNRLTEFYSKCGLTRTARHVFDQMPHPNIYSWHAMLTAHCKAGQLEHATELFVKMPERNSVSWNTMISALARNGYESKALEVYRMMTSGGFEPTHITLASVLSACGGLRGKEFGRVSHGLAVKYGLDRNVYVGNALLSMYVKCGCGGDAIKVFGDLPERNEVSFTAMMSGLVEIDQVEEAFNMFRLMQRNGFRIDSVSLSSVLRVCAKGDGGDFVIDDINAWYTCNVPGKQVHSLVVKLGFESDLRLCNSLLDMYVKNKDMDSAEVLFGDLPEVSNVSWNIMIGGFGQNYEKKRAMEYMEKMQSCGYEPDEVTYINMLAACVKAGDVEAGCWLFERMACPSLSSWNAMLSGYSQNGDHCEAINLFRKMQFQNERPDRTTLAIILTSCAEIALLEYGKQLHAASFKNDVSGDIYVASSLIGMYSKCGWVKVAKCIFKRLPQLDIVCWNSMISGLNLNSLDKEAFSFFKEMLQIGMPPSEFSYATVLSSCARLSSLALGTQVHGMIARGGYANDVVVGSALINMYSKCGDIDGARLCFDMMPCKNSITWNEMIHGYAQNGYGDKAIFLYEQMIETGNKPDGVTFIAVLTACTHSGLVDRGIRIFHSMQLEYGVEPLVDHYTCIIDCLGRAGRFDEVEELLNKMPYKDDPIIWEVLLSTCRVHMNVSLARRAAVELFRLDPENSVPYVLLANMYSSLGRWDESKGIREMMVEGKVVKDFGFSWVENQNGIEENGGTYTVASL